MANKVEKEFVSILDWAGKAFKVGLAETVKYLPAATSLASLIFPQAAAPLAEATSAADLIQNAVTSTEQMYAVSGMQNGTGTQKAAEVLTLTKSAVTTLLAEPDVTKELQAAGITVNDTYIGNLISAVVGILNVQGVPASTSSISPVPVSNPLAPAQGATT